MTLMYGKICMIQNLIADFKKGPFKCDAVFCKVGIAVLVCTWAHLQKIQFDGNDFY